MKTFETTQLSEQQVEGALLDEEIKRGIEASEAGDKVGAETIFRQIVTQYPGTLEAWIWLGWTSSTLDSSEEAFTAASALDPHNEEAQLGLRWVATQRPVVQARTSSLGPITQDAPNVSEVSSESHAPQSPLPENWTYESAMRQAVTASRAGDRPHAYVMFRQIAERHPESSAVWVWCGGTSPTLEDAEAAFKRAQELDPNNEEAGLGLRWVALRRQVERQTAQGSTDHSVAAYPNSTRTIANLTGNNVVPAITHDRHEDSPAATPAETEVASAKKLSAFARFLKKFNIPLPLFLLLVLAVVVVWTTFIVVYLSGPAH